MFRMEFYDGKYTYINDNGKQSVLRYGENWSRRIVGDGFILAMGQELEEQQNTIKTLQNSLKTLQNSLNPSFKLYNKEAWDWILDSFKSDKISQTEKQIKDYGVHQYISDCFQEYKQDGIDKGLCFKLVCFAIKIL